MKYQCFIVQMHNAILMAKRNLYSTAKYMDVTLPITTILADFSSRSKHD